MSLAGDKDDVLPKLAEGSILSRRLNWLECECGVAVVQSGHLSCGDHAGCDISTGYIRSYLKLMMTYELEQLLSLIFRQATGFSQPKVTWPVSSGVGCDPTHAGTDAVFSFCRIYLFIGE